MHHYGVELFQETILKGYQIDGMITALESGGKSTTELRQGNQAIKKPRYIAQFTDLLSVIGRYLRLSWRHPAYHLV